MAKLLAYGPLGRDAPLGQDGVPDRLVAGRRLGPTTESRRGHVNGRLCATVSDPPQSRVSSGARMQSAGGLSTSRAVGARDSLAEVRASRCLTTRRLPTHPNERLSMSSQSGPPRRSKRGGRSLKDKIGGALSAQAFKHLVDQRGTDLAIAGIAATVGHTSGGPKNPGPTWISLISHRAYGRLIRGLTDPTNRVRIVAPTASNSWLPTETPSLRPTSTTS